MCLKCPSCGNRPSLSLEAPHTAHLICDLCNTSESHTLTTTQFLSLEQCDPKERLRKVELFITLNTAKSNIATPIMGGEHMNCNHMSLEAWPSSSATHLWKCSDCKREFALASPQ